jgi:hypothetical protein
MTSRIGPKTAMDRELRSITQYPLNKPSEFQAHREYTLIQKLTGKIEFNSPNN